MQIHKPFLAATTRCGHAVACLAISLIALLAETAHAESIDPSTVLGVHFTTTAVAQTPGGPIPIAPAPTYSGTAALGIQGIQTGSYFNNVVLGDTDARATKTFSDQTLSGLLASDGTTQTGITVTLGAVDQFTTALLPASADSPLLDSYAFAGSRGTFTISGLAPSAIYTLYIYSQNGSASSSATTFYVSDGDFGGASKSISNLSPAPNDVTAADNFYELFAGSYLGDYYDGYYYAGYGYFDGVRYYNDYIYARGTLNSYSGNELSFYGYSSSAGTISGSFYSPVTDAATFNGFQLIGDLNPAVTAAPLPSPAIAGAGILSGIVLLALRRCGRRNFLR